MNYSELLQLAKGWGNFISGRIIIWRLQLNIIFVLLIFFNISVTVQIEDSDIAIFQLILLMNPYDLFIHIDRFHTDAGNVDAEVCGCGDIITDFKFFILIRVKKEAGIGRRRFCKYFAFCS